MKIIKICLQCKIEFKSYDVGKRQFTKYCSRNCKSLSQKIQKVERQIINCPTCNHEFFKLPCIAKKFCSRRCQHEDLKIWNKLSETQKIERGKASYEKYVIKNEIGCWDWKGAIQKEYGTFLYDGKLMRSHRFSWIIHKGNIPNGLHILHNCPNGDNPRCSNPSHLFLGSHKDNMLDMRKKGLHKQHSKLTKEQVVEIKHLLSSNELTQKQIGDKYDVHHVTIHDIKYSKTWKSIT